MEPETVNIIIAISSAFTALGTISAVIVALWLARRDKNINLEVSVAITRHILMAAQPIPDENEYLSVTVTNIGIRDATVTSSGWEYGILKKQSFIQLYDFENPYIARLPKKLMDGDRAELFISLNDFRRNTDFLNSIYDGPFNRLWFLFLRHKIYTSTGDIFSTRLESTVRKRFLNLKKDLNNK
ncbi:MAG: hypothetical protein WDZ29_03285 [Balneolaceae bacterium]